MAMNPVMRKLEKHIEKAGGDTFILDRIAAGESVGKIALTIKLPGHGVISRPFLYRWRDKDEDRAKGWGFAMKESSHALAEDAGDVWEDLDNDPTSAQVAKARGQSDYKKWLAGKRNKEDYGDGPAIAVGILTAGDLHLDALRMVGHMDTQRLAADKEREEIPVADYEDVTDEEEDAC